MRYSECGTVQNGTFINICKRIKLNYKLLTKLYFKRLKTSVAEIGNVAFIALISKFNINGSPSKNPYIKTPLVMSFSLGVVIHFCHHCGTFRE